MRDEFRPYSHRPDADDQRRAWTEGIVVLDTGAVLGLYRYPKRTADDLVRVYEALGDRVWLPHQAAVEFYRNREGVIAAQEAVFDAAQSAVQRGVEALREVIEKVVREKQIQDRHGLLDATDLLDPFDDALEAVLGVIGRKRGEQQTAVGADPVLDTVERLFRERVTPTPTQDDLDAIYKEGTERYGLEIPPGYEDQKEKAGESFRFGGLTYRREYGDLALWKQSLALAKEQGASSLVVVTDDQKGDWWAVESGRTLGPRRELVEEARGVGVETLLFYTPRGVLERGAELLGVAVDRGSAAGADLPAPTDSFGGDQRPWTTGTVLPSNLLAAFNPEQLEAFRRVAEAQRVAEAVTPSESLQRTLAALSKLAPLFPREPGTGASPYTGMRGPEDDE